MSNSIEHFGVVYDEKTDWRAFLRDVLAGRAYEGLNIDPHVGESVPSALGELSEALHGTPMEIGLADAALDVIERGSEDDRLIVESAGWEKAPDGLERMLALVERTPRQLSPLWTYKLYRAMFGLRPTHSRLLASFTKDVFASLGEELADYLALAASYNLDWLVEHLPALRPPLTSDMRRWITHAGKAGKAERDFDPVILDNNRARLLNAIAQLGEPYADALVVQLKRPPVLDYVMRAVQQLPQFARRL